MQCWSALREGFPLLSGEDRLAFRSALGDPLFETWHSNRIIIALFLGMIAAGGWRLLGLSLLLAHVALSLMFAEKFTSLNAYSLRLCGRHRG